MQDGMRPDMAALLGQGQSGKGTKGFAFKSNIEPGAKMALASLERASSWMLARGEGVATRSTRRSTR